MLARFAIKRRTTDTQNFSQEIPKVCATFVQHHQFVFFRDPWVIRIHPFEQGVVQLQMEIVVLDSHLAENFSGTNKRLIGGVEIVTGIVTGEVGEEAHGFDGA